MPAEYISNGLNGATGGYLLSATTAQQVSQIAREEVVDESHIFELERKLEKGLSEKGIIRGNNPVNLDEAGWGVIFASTYKHEETTGLTAEKIRKALSPLLERRQAQATAKNETYYREFIGSKKPNRAFNIGESKRDFLIKNKVPTGIGVANPKYLPYYLLIVGDPETIPFSFQYELDVEYAVGRIYFDTWEQYRTYAETIVSSEKGTYLPTNSSPKRATFFAVRNQDDQATRNSSDYLIPALVQHLQEQKKTVNPQEWSIETVLKEETTKAKLATLLGGTDTPDFLFTASHGIAFPKDHELHTKHQGALVCQDWLGPREWENKPIPPTFYFSADDIDSDAQLQGLIAFHFACYGAGMPTHDNFHRQTADDTPTVIADQEFIAKLPQSLLGHPNGGALAVIGHIERTWTRSFQSEEELPRIGVFQSMLSSLFDGEPVGLAMEYFDQRYGVCATELHHLIDTTDASDDELASLWLDTNDARNYIILGDPAVKIGIRPIPNEQTSSPKDATLEAKNVALQATITQLTKQIALLEQQVEALTADNQHLQEQINRLREDT